MGSKPKDIRITEVSIEPSDGEEIEILYVPKQTQTLYAGRLYKFVFDLSQGVVIKEVDDGSAAVSIGGS
jgi:hypothetical protein